MLLIAMYHYVISPNPRFRGLKGMDVDDFRRQISTFSEQYDMASAASALDYLAGTYRPRKPMLLTSFDDGLVEHAGVVSETLQDHGATGVFALPTRPIEERWISPTHKNHLLLGELPVSDYAERIHHRLTERPPPPADETVRATYRWDAMDVARLKYLINFQMEEADRNRILDEVFADVFGDERAVADDFHLTWADARRMGDAGMTLAAHGHSHAAISSFDTPRQEVMRCTHVLDQRLGPTSPRIFTFPFGKEHSFGQAGVDAVRAAGFDAAFSTIVGTNATGQDRYRLKRLDPKDFEARG